MALGVVALSLLLPLVKGCDLWPDSALMCCTGDGDEALIVAGQALTTSSRSRTAAPEKGGTN